MSQPTSDLPPEPPPSDLEAVTFQERAPRYFSATRRIQLGSRSLREFAARGMLINTGFMIGLSALSLIRGFALAIFLTASDYGVWGVLSVSLGTLMWLKQVGIGDKYLQQDEEDQELAFQKAFTLEAIFTGCFAVVLLLAVPLVVVVYGESQLLLPGLVLVLLLPAGVLQASLWVYAREMNFLRQRILQSIEPVLGFIVALGLAIAGFGYWALAAGLLVGTWATALVSVALSPYRLRFRYDAGTMRSYRAFSWPLFVAHGSSLVIAQTAVIAGEAKVGLAGVGAIALAISITSFTDRVDSLITGTLYPAICAIRDRIDLQRESFVKSNRLALMWAVPFGTGIALFASDLVTYVLGEKWRDAVVLLQIIGANAGLAHVAYNWDAYMRANDQTRPMAVAGVVAAVTFVLTGLPLLLLYELPGLGAGIVLQTVAHVIVRAYYLRRLFHGFSYLRQALRAVLPVAPALALVLLSRVVETGERTGLHAIGELVGFVVVVCVATWYIERRLIREALGYLRARQAVAVTP